MSSQNPFDPQQGGRSLHQNTPLPLHMPWGSYHDDPCSASVVFSFRFTQLRILEQAAGHLRWNVDYQPSQPVGSGFKPHWRPQPAKLPSFGGYSLETLPYLTLHQDTPLPLNMPPGLSLLADINLMPCGAVWRPVFLRGSRCSR